MEISDALRLSRGRIFLLLTIMLTAGAVAAFAVSSQPSRYSARSLVYLPHDGGALNTFSIDPLAASLESALRLASTMRSAEEQSGVSRGVLEAGLETFREPGDPQVTVQVTAASERQAGEGAQALGSAALTALATRQVDNARLGVEGARGALEAADRDVVTLVRALGVVDIDATLAALTTQMTDARAEGATGEVARLEAEISRLVGERPRFQAVTSTRSAAQEALSQNLQALAAAEAQVAYAQSDQAVVSQGVTEVDRRTVLVRSVLGAMVVAGLLTVVGLVAVTVLRTRRRRGAPPEHAADRVDTVGVGSTQRAAAGPARIDVRRTHAAAEPAPRAADDASSG